MFGTQAMRLLRTMWKTPTMLAQELFAMFQSDVPLEHDAPVTLKSSGDEAPLKISRGFSDGPLINFSRGGENIGGFSVVDGAIVFRGDNVSIPSLDLSAANVAGGPTPATTTPKQDQQPNSGCFPGQVVSGSGDTYTVTVYVNGLSLATVDATVKQLSIDAAATIKAGTWVLVARSPGGEYTMQSPVWGADP